MPTLSDPAISAACTALADGRHDLDEATVTRPQDTARYIIVRYTPWDSDDLDGRAEMHAGYAASLRAAGWHGALDLGDLVLVPDVPPADTEPGTFTATWAVGVNASNSQDAADQARGHQIDLGVTEAVWTVTDSVGRTAIVNTQDPDLA